mgnify:CR=1 FL=1
MIDGNDVIIAYKNGSIIDAHFKKQKLTPDKTDDFQSTNLTKIGDDQLKFTFSRKIKTDDTDHDTNLNQLKGIFIIEKNGRKVDKSKESKGFDFTSLKEFQQSSSFENEGKNINESHGGKGANGRSRKVTEIETLEEVHETTYDEETDTTKSRNENEDEGGSVLNQETDTYDYEDYESYEDDHEIEMKESQMGKLSKIGRGYESKKERNESVLTEIESNDNQKTDQQLDHDSQQIEKEANQQVSKLKKKKKDEKQKVQNIKEEEDIYEYDESYEAIKNSKNQSKTDLDTLDTENKAAARSRVDFLQNETIQEDEEYEDRNKIHESYEADGYSEESRTEKPRYGDFGSSVTPPQDDEDIITTSEYTTTPDDDEDVITTTESITTPDDDEDVITTSEYATPPDDDEDVITTTEYITPPDDDEDIITTTEPVTPPEDNVIITKPWWQESTTTEEPFYPVRTLHKIDLYSINKSFLHLGID